MRGRGKPAAGGVARSGRLRFEEGTESFGEGRAAAIAVDRDVEGTGDFEVAELETPDEAATALLIHRASRDDRHAHAGLDRLLDGLGRPHLSPDVEGGEVQPC